MLVYADKANFMKEWREKTKLGVTIQSYVVTDSNIYELYLVLHAIDDIFKSMHKLNAQYPQGSK